MMGFDLSLAAGALNYLRREELVRNVIRHLRGDALPPDAHTGRYTFLWRAISPELGVTTIDEDWSLEPEQVQRAWRRTCEQHAQTPSFWHGIAVVEREWALEAEGREDFEATAHHWCRANSVFCHVLCCPDFWSSVERSGINLEPDQTERVREELIGRIIDEHLTRANQLWQTDPGQAQVHAGCIRRLAELPLDDPIEGIGVTPSLGGDPAFAQQVRLAASEAIEGWANQWLFRAEQMLVDEERLSRQRPGITRAYADAISHVMTFLDLVPDSERAARYAVRQYNSFAQDAIAADREGLFENVMAESHRAARYLEPLAVRGEGGHPNNVALCERLTFCAITDCDTEETVGYLVEALAWNPGDADALRLLEEAKDLPIQEELHEAYELIEAARYGEAEEVLDALEERIGEVIEPLRQLRGLSRFHQGDAAAASRAFERAAELMAEAAELVPNEETVTRMSSLLDRMALEADDYRAYYIASDRLNAGDAVSAMALTEAIAPDFSEYAAVRKLRARICFGESVRLANEHDEYEAAIALADTAIELDPVNTTLREQRKELGSAFRASLAARAMQAAEAGDIELATQLIEQSRLDAEAQERREALDKASITHHDDDEQSWADELAAAVTCMECGDCEEALMWLHRISPRFSRYEAVEQILWQACFEEGTRVAHELGDLDRACELLERAARHVDDRHRSSVEQRLDELRQRRAREQR